MEKFICGLATGAMLMLTFLTHEQRVNQEVGVFSDDQISNVMVFDKNQTEKIEELKK